MYYKTLQIFNNNINIQNALFYITAFALCTILITFISVNMYGFARYDKK